MPVVAYRRALLKLAAGLPVSLPAFDLMAAGDRRVLHVYPVTNQPLASTPGAGAIVLVDAGIKRFAGTGYYLFPDWGQPVVYEVRRSGNKLSFRYPGNKQVQWVMSEDDPETRFSGRVESLLCTSCPVHTIEQRLAARGWPQLEVPQQVHT